MRGKSLDANPEMLVSSLKSPPDIARTSWLRLLPQLPSSPACTDSITTIWLSSAIGQTST